MKDPEVINLHLCLLGEKAFSFLLGALRSGVSEKNHVTIEVGRDDNLTNDFAEEIFSLAKNFGISVQERSLQANYANAHLVFVVGWRWIIKDVEDSRLIVIHDSLLPKYRGFAPLVNALLNMEKYIGVSVLYGNEDYDKGSLIAQRKILVDYPVRISSAIRMISKLYEEIGFEMCGSCHFSWIGVPQCEGDASYSPWLDEEDYFIDWNSDAAYIAHKINLLGKPYKHAKTYMNGQLVSLEEASVVKDLKIVRQDIGKVIIVDNGCPLVICGSGVVKLSKILDHSETKPVLITKFRTRFSNDSIQ